MTLEEIGAKAKKASYSLSCMGSAKKNEALLSMANAIRENCAYIIEKNAEDIEAARGKIKDSLIDRLSLDEKRVNSMADGIEDVISLPDPIGVSLGSSVRPNGLLITWATYVSEEKANGLLPAGDYSFGEDGKMILRNGMALDDYGKLCYYINGAQQYDTGLVLWEGDYYYVRPNGLILTWATYVSEEKANGLLPAGDYTFGEDGKMILEG